MTLSLTSIPTAPDASPKGLSASPGAGRKGLGADYVVALQKALRSNDPTIDLGKTGPLKDGVDGRYGNKTRDAVKAVANKLGIKDPLDNSGRPSAEMNAKLGLANPPPRPSAPGAPATPTPPTDKGAKAPASENEDKDVLNQFTLSDGTVFLMVPFLRGFPRGGLTLEDEPWAAVQALRQMQYALESGGLKVDNKLPKSFQGISTIEEYDNYMDQVRATVLEIQTKCRLVADSFIAAVNRRRKELGLPPASKPATKGSKDEVYGFELAYWNGALAGVSIATSAQAILSTKLLQFIRGTRRPLLTLLKESVDVNPLFKDSKLNDAAAKEIGSIIAETQTELARQIDPADSAYYFTFNKDPPEMKSRLQKVLTDSATVQEIRQAIIDQA
jgi:hypothetical protein